jgi:hypothetical protein
MKNAHSGNDTHSDTVCGKDSITAKLLEIDEDYNFVPAAEKWKADLLIEMVKHQIKRLSEGEYVN